MAVSGTEKGGYGTATVPAAPDRAVAVDAAFTFKAADFGSTAATNGDTLANVTVATVPEAMA